MRYCKSAVIKGMNTSFSIPLQLFTKFNTLLSASILSYVRDFYTSSPHDSLTPSKAISCIAGSIDSVSRAAFKDALYNSKSLSWNKNRTETLLWENALLQHSRILYCWTSSSRSPGSAMTHNRSEGAHVLAPMWEKCETVYFKLI